MRLVNVLSDCTVKAATASPELSMADAARAIRRADAVAAVVMENDNLLGILTPVDVFRVLTFAANPILAWNGPVRAALTEEPKILTAEETVGAAIRKMVAAGRDYLPMAMNNVIVVVSLCRLLLVESTSLHSEVQHLQTYIDALHDAPND